MSGNGDIDLSRSRRVHLLGIGGAGMSGIARLLDGLGHVVSGSDAREAAVLDDLRALGMRVVVGHRPDAIGDAEIVGRSTAVADDNVEVLEAHARSLPVYGRSELLAAIGDQRDTLSVSGTHGKTTTSAMLAVALDAAGEQPSFLVGSTIGNFGVAARLEPTRYLVLEGDESDSTFLAPRRVGAIVTNVEPDHLDHHGSLDALHAAFDRYVAHTDGPVVVCADDAGSASLASRHDACVTYGTAVGADWVIDDVAESAEETTWTVRSAGSPPAELRLPARGMHLVRNATAVYVLGCLLSLDGRRLADGLAGFGGTARRFEARGSARGVTFVDDYAHLPTEVAATMATARGGGWRRVVAVVQPHRYSRTAATWDQYGEALVGADVVVVTDVYAAGERPISGVSGELIARAVAEADPDRPVIWEPSREALATTLLDVLGEGDLCLTLGAGDVTNVADEVLALMGEVT